MLDAGMVAPGPEPVRRGTVTRAEPAGRVRRLPADSLVDLRRNPPAARRGRRRQRDGRLHGPRGLRGAAAAGGAAVLRAGRHLPQPRGEPAGAGEPGRPAAGGPADRRGHRAWPSTATPTAVSSSTNAANRCRPARSPRWSPAANCARHPGATILYNLISSHAVPEIVTEAGGVPIRTRVGHSFIKAEMARDRRGFRW